MNTFNSREIATAIWIAALLVFIVLKTPKAPSGVLKTLFHPKLLIPILLMALYSIAVTWSLYLVNFWTLALLKETVIWFVLWAVVSIFSFATSDDDKNFLKNVVAENLKIIVLFQFLVNTYTFSIPVELIFLPVVSFVIMLRNVAQ